MPFSLKGKRKDKDRGSEQAQGGERGAADTLVMAALISVLNPSANAYGQWAVWRADLVHMR